MLAVPSLTVEMVSVALATLTVMMLVSEAVAVYVQRLAFGVGKIAIKVHSRGCFVFYGFGWESGVAVGGSFGRIHRKQRRSQKYSHCPVSVAVVDIVTVPGGLRV